MSAGSEALKAARTALQVAARPNSSEEDRRAFISRLLALPRDPSIDAKSFFVTLLPKYFAEFADLQDEQIDGLLDICEHEEEQVRIIGIKGLATVAKADKNWAKSNANVLLQLLECPPSELKVVKQTLLSLLSSAPHETLSVLLDDIASAEGATGIPRLNILKFLLNDAEGWRKEFLQSAREIDLEKDFFDGLVKTVNDIPLKETRIIIDMLSDLSIIAGTGRDTDPKRLDRLVRALTTSLEADSSVNTSMAHINTFAQVIKRAKVDGRSALAFLARHGGAVVELALGKKDKVAEGVLEQMYGWVKDAERGWKVDKDKDEDKVARGVVDTILDEVLRCTRDVKTRELEKQAEPLERILWPIYELVSERSRRDLIRSSIISKLNGIDDAANSAYKDEGKKSVLGRRLRNIRDIADYLADSKASRLDSQPTWLERTSSTRSAAPSQTPAHAPAPIATRPPPQRVQPGPSSRPMPYSRPSPHARASGPGATIGPGYRPAGSHTDSSMQRAAPPHLAPSGPSRSTSSARPRSRSPERRPDSARDSQNRSREQQREPANGLVERDGRHSDPYRPSHDRSPSRASLPAQGDRYASAPRRDRSPPPSTKHKRSPSPAPQSAKATPAQPPSTQDSPNVRPSTTRSVEPMASSSPPSASSRGVESLASKHAVGTNGSSRGVELIGPPGHAEGESEGSSRGKELLQNKQKDANVDQPPTALTVANAKSVPDPAQDLHATLSIRNFANATGKRSRADSCLAAETDATPTKNAPTSLLSRLSRPSGQQSPSVEAEHLAKRPRTSSEATQQPPVKDDASATGSRGRASRLSRLGSSTPARAPSSPSPAPVAPTPGLTIRARASAPADIPPKPAFSVLGRSSAPSAAAPPKPAIGSESASRSNPAAVPDVALASTPRDEPIRRKGRGFAAQELSEIVVRPETHLVPAWNPLPKAPINPNAHAQVPAKSLQARLQPAVVSSGAGHAMQGASQAPRSLAQRLGM